MMMRFIVISGVKNDMVDTEDNERTVISIKDLIYYLEIACQRLANTGFKETETLKNAINTLKSKS